MSEPILNVDHVTRTFRERGRNTFHAVKDISISIYEGECVGIVGESGCGKSTLARMITGLLKPSSGKIKFCGENLTEKKRSEMKSVYQNMKMIFQEPRSSFDPRYTLGKSIQEALLFQIKDKKEREQEVIRLLEEVGLNASFAALYPNQVSGGECQRAAIARAIAQKPKLLICDEATSALDVSVQAQVLNLMNIIREKYNISFLFISHDLALVSSFCDRIYVLCNGSVVEQGKTMEIIKHPKEAYTRRLLESVFTIS